MKGESLYKIATLMGNSPEICRRHYATLLPESLVQSVEFEEEESQEAPPSVNHVFVGNADTRILLSETEQEIPAEVKRCMDIGKDYPGFFMAVGNHIPPNTPVENALYYNRCFEELCRR